MPIGSRRLTNIVQHIPQVLHRLRSAIPKSVAPPKAALAPAQIGHLPRASRASR